MLNAKFQPFRRACRRLLIGPVLLASYGLAEPADLDLEAMRSALIPKREVGADVFLQDNPTYDGRGVIIAIFDTGVDPAAAGLSVTTQGERKVLDILDASGSGDVDTTTVTKLDDAGELQGLSGLKLGLPRDLVNPSGEFRLGVKAAKELFSAGVLARLADQDSNYWQTEVNQVRTTRAQGDRKLIEAAQQKAPADRSRTEQDLVARGELLTKLEDDYISSGSGPMYDCAMWHDGTSWRVLIDTDRDGDLADEKQLRPFGIAGEFGTFDAYTNASFGVQVYEEGKLLSIVTVSGTHGSHVASIATAHFPGEPERSGIAPGAQVLSIKIGDIRTGGSSHGISERRALALAATYGVDIVNASWGGSSIFQDGADSNAKIYRTLVERYDILAVLSAGNNGPALSTNGSAGGESSRVLGVGAYGSTEMAKALYNSVKDSPNAALQFSSRGPTKDGDIGVDLMAPGAAWASYSSESLTGAQMINGTSMSSPSAAGVAALVLSAAKQQGLKHEPARLRNALILGAQPIAEEDVLTAGGGLINVGGAWSKLQALQAAPEFRVFYDLGVSGGTYTDSGRGLYLRETIDTLRKRVTATVTPAWPESVSAEERYRFETDLELVPSEGWIDVPTYTHLANGDQRITVVMDIPPMSENDRQMGSVVTGRVDAFVAGKRDLGPLFSIPITIVRPADETLFVEQKRRTDIALVPAETKRLFLQVPERAERLQLRLKHVAKDPIARRYFIQALTPTAHSSQDRFLAESVPWLEEGDVVTMNIPVAGGAVTEIAFNQYFYSFGDSTLEAELEWLGVGLPVGSVTMEPNQGWLPVQLDPLSDRQVNVEAKLEYGRTVYLPKTATEFYDDARSLMPASALTPGPDQTPMMRLTYELEFKEPVAAAVSDPQQFDGSEQLGGGRITVTHESGDLLYDGFPNLKKPIKFPKGKSTIIREYSSQFDNVLDATESFALVLAVPLKPAKSVAVSSDLRTAFDGKDADSLALQGGRERIIFLRDTLIDDLVKMDPMPDYFTGFLQFEDEEKHLIAKEALNYFPGKSPKKTTNQDAKAKPAKDLKSESEKLADSWYDLQLKFVRDHRTKTEPEIVAQRQNSLIELRAARPDDPAPIIEQAIDLALSGGLVSEFWGKSESKDDVETPDPVDAAKDDSFVEKVRQPGDADEVIALLDEAAVLTDSAAVAAFFGAKPLALPGDKSRQDEIAAETKRFEVSRTNIAQIALLRADVLRATQALDAAWQAFAEVARWEEKPSKNAKALETELWRASGLWGLALKGIDAEIEKDPYNADLINKRIDLYRELGWGKFVTQQMRVLAERAHRKRLLNNL